jgi:hypothetical protein
LDIPEHVFAESLDTFIDANAEMIVEVYETKGKRYVRQLGQTARYNCTDLIVVRTGLPGKGNIACLESFHRLVDLDIRRNGVSIQSSVPSSRNEAGR